MPSSKFQTASHEAPDTTYAAIVDTLQDVVGDREASGDHVRVVFEEANNNLQHQLTQRGAQSPLDELQTIHRTYEAACVRFWQIAALFGTHHHYNKSWPVFATDHQAPSAVRGVLTTKARDCGIRLRPLRCALSIQDAWGTVCYQCLRAVAPFPLEPKHSFLEELAKLSRLQSLDAVEHLFPHFLTTRIARHTHSLSNQKRVLAGTRPVGVSDIQEFIARGTSTNSVRTTFREPRLRHRTAASLSQPIPHSSGRRESGASIELPRRAE
jgi:hypothetical protein